jgi:hypothetical protein
MACGDEPPGVVQFQRQRQGVAEMRDVEANKALRRLGKIYCIVDLGDHGPPPA